MIAKEDNFDTAPRTITSNYFREWYRKRKHAPSITSESPMALVSWGYRPLVHEPAGTYLEDDQCQ